MYQTVTITITGFILGRWWTKSRWFWILFNWVKGVLRAEASCYSEKLSCNSPTFICRQCHSLVGNVLGTMGLYFVYTIKHHPIDQSVSLKISGLMSVFIGAEMNLAEIVIFMDIGIYFIYLCTKRKQESMKCLQAAWCWDLNTQNITLFSWTLRQMSDHGNILQIGQ